MPDISKINALAIGSVSKVDGLAKASILDIDGVAVPSAALLLDTYTGAKAGYSVRLLNSAYTGACMRVRRASDSVEADVGFDTSDELSLTSPISNTSDAQSYTDLANFVDHTGTPTDAFVTSWYDQSTSGGTGSGFDAEQATAGSQPQIYDATTGLIDENGKPAVYSPGSKNLVAAGLALAVTGDIDIDFFAAIKNDSANGTSSSGLFGLGVSNTADADRRRVYCFGNDSATLKSVRLFGGNTVVTSSATGQVLFNTNYQGGGGAFDVRFDGSSTSVSSFSNTGLNIQQNSRFCLFTGNSNDGSTQYLDPDAVGYIQEVVFYLSDQGSTDRTGIENNINGFFGIY